MARAKSAKHADILRIRGVKRPKACMFASELALVSQVTGLGWLAGWKSQAEIT